MPLLISHDIVHVRFTKSLVSYPGLNSLTEWIKILPTLFVSVSKTDGNFNLAAPAMFLWSEDCMLRATWRCNWNHVQCALRFKMSENELFTGSSFSWGKNIIPRKHDVTRPHTRSSFHLFCCTHNIFRNTRMADVIMTGPHEMATCYFWPIFDVNIFMWYAIY